MNFFNIKLKYQLLILVIISVFMVISAQIIYFVSFDKLTKERAGNYFSEIIEQMKSRILLNTNTIEELSDIISYNISIQEFIVEDDSIKRFDTVRYVRSSLNTIQSANKNILSVLIIDSKNTIISSESDNNYMLYNRIINDNNILEKNNNFEAFYTNIYYDDTSKEPYYAYIRPIFSTDKFSQERAGTNIIICKANELEQTIYSKYIPPKAVFSLISADNSIFATNANDSNIVDLKSMIQILNLDNTDKNGEIVFDGAGYLYQFIYFEETKWSLFFFIPINELTNDMISIRNTGILIVLVALVLTSGIGFVLINSITHPINKIITDMEKLGRSNEKQRLEIIGENEISIITKYINSMLKRIEEVTHNMLDTQKRLYTIEISKKHTELLALQNQINPHFLYNTLECIRSISAYHNIDEISQISTAMAKIFRYSIKAKDIVTIEDEFDCIRDYCSIIFIRYMGNIQLVEEIDKCILEKQIVKMILQPVIENSVYHGLETKGGKGNVFLKGYIDDLNYIVIEISDDGIGISKEQLNKLRHSLSDESVYNDINKDNGGLGLINISRRLRLYYGENYYLGIESTINEGTVVTLKIPDIQINDRESSGENL